MKRMAFLRGVTPTGKNKIPSMKKLETILTNIGFKNVKTYIHTGNVIFESEEEDRRLKNIIHDTILKEIGADLPVIIKSPEEVKEAITYSPFREGYKLDRVLIFLTNDSYNGSDLEELIANDREGEEISEVNGNIFLYIPKEAVKKQLSNNFLEKKLNIVGTTRKVVMLERFLEKI